MAATKRSSRGRTQDRSRVAAGQKYEVAYMARKTGRAVGDVKSAIKKAGSNMRKAVEDALGGAKKTSRKSSAKKSTAKRAGARKTTASKSGARKSARKSTAKKSGGRKTSTRSTARKSDGGSSARKTTRSSSARKAGARKSSTGGH